MEDAGWKFVQILLERATVILVPAIMAIIGTGATYAVGWLRAKVGEQKWATIQAAVEMAVYAAEQSNLGKELQLAGNEKKALAKSILAGYLAAQGIKIDVEQLGDLIEATLAKTLNYDKTHGWQTIGGTVEQSTSE
jgi:hypothetical protein